MSKILSVGTSVPDYKHKQGDILEFMQRVYALDDDNRRKIKYLYRQSGIDTRHSIIPDYSLPAPAWHFYSPTENLEPFPSLELRMQWYEKYAAALSLTAIRQCLKKFPLHNITHLITVSCTGMSAPGLDLELMELLELPRTTFRTSVNFMGCYAAIHAMKMAMLFVILIKKPMFLLYAQSCVHFIFRKKQHQIILPAACCSATEQLQFSLVITKQLKD